MKIDGTSAIVTGGASGLGAATAKALSDAGAKVTLFDLNEEAGQAHAAAIGGLFVKVDVADEQSVIDGVAAAREAHGAARILVNCAGIGPASKTVGRKGPHSLALFKKVIDVNLGGTFNVLRLAAADMVNNEPNAGGERGVIVNTASVAAFDGQMGQAAYAASKGGIVGLTLPVARDLSRYGIRVCCIAPGIFLTPLLMGLPEEVRESLGKSVPFPSRLGDPSEFAALAQHIIENPMLNGETIRLDGALRMAPR
ncbi:MAG: NAD(P)-dependent dehydrogenase (short-subunit alcohol dehydrogenase family) [Myxococcota bacterium]|jgi:NAD(P)-dependent dehydrogenase (short-subunit alcohol dehydrogenase family)